MWSTHLSRALLVFGCLLASSYAAFNKKSSVKSQQHDAMAAFVRSSLPGPWVEPWEMPRIDTCLPQLMLIGANKAGILPWYWYARLGYHPALMVSKVENIEYFTVKYNASMTLAKYTHLFPRICKRDKPLEGKCSLVPEDATRPAAIRADASPHYLANPLVPARIKQDLPDMRFLVILRNPTHRTVSQFNMFWQLSKIGKLCLKGQECNFSPWNSSKAIVQSPQNVQEIKQHYLRDLHVLADTLTTEIGACYKSDFRNTWDMIMDCFKLRNLNSTDVHSALDRLSFVWYSMYADQLTWWFQKFRPSQFLIWSSRDFHQNPEAHMSQLVEWLGLPLEDINTEVKLSRTIGSAMYISKIPKDLVAKFNNFYKPHNERLFQTLVKKGFAITAQKLRRDFK